MSTQLNNAILSQMSTTEYTTHEPGGPLYIGSVDYPNTVYTGYIGSSHYIYEPRSTGYGVIDDSKVFQPVAKFPNLQNFKNLNKYTLIDIFAPCNIPLFFQTEEDDVRKCSLNFGLFFFKGLLIVNTLLMLLLHKYNNPKYLILFIIFHMILYYMLTTIYSTMTIREWKTIQKYKFNIKLDEDFTEFDTPNKQFEEINKHLLDQVINKRKIIYISIFLSVILHLINIK